MSSAAKSFHKSGRPFSLFELLGNEQSEESIQNRYAVALKLVKSESIGIFTVKNGYSMKRFVKWTPAMRRQIRRYYNAIVGLQQYNVRVKTAAPRDKKKRIVAQKAARHGGLYGKLKHVYVPGTPKYQPRVKFDKKGRAFITDDYFDEFPSHFRIMELILGFANDDEERVYAECERVWVRMIELAGGRKPDFVTIITGESESFGMGMSVRSADALFKIVMEIFEEYGETTRRWLKGINGYFRRKGQKLAPGMGSLSAMHQIDLDEKRSLRRKIRRASPEAKRMSKRREVREIDYALQLKEVTEKLEQAIAKYEARKKQGYVPIEINKTHQNRIKELSEKVKQLQDKLLARSRYNKRKR